jgi:hypothetical protein
VLPHKLVLCGSEFMNEDAKQKLDKELRSERLKNIKVFSYFTIPLILFGVYAIGFIGSEKATVIGTVTSHYTSLHEEGHDLYIMVSVPDRVNLAKVKLPHTVTIKLGSKVELSSRTNDFFSNTKYRFVKYVE